LPASATASRPELASRSSSIRAIPTCRLRT
jgi:hypothetical protein